MNRIGKLLGLAAAACAGFCATRILPLSDADRGRGLSRERGCMTCHSINGEGGKRAPDLGRMVERGFSPYRLAGLLWNHAPVMWAAVERARIARPELTRQEAADLFAYFFAARYFESPGGAGGCSDRRVARDVMGYSPLCARASGQWRPGSLWETPFRSPSRCGTTPGRCGWRSTGRKSRVRSSPRRN
ncbi:MAG: cytochrome c [Bryobacteraceae bacterium]